jgi:hypothetical protein
VEREEKPYLVTGHEAAIVGDENRTLDDNPRQPPCVAQNMTVMAVDFVLPERVTKPKKTIDNLSEIRRIVPLVTASNYYTTGPAKATYTGLHFPHLEAMDIE